MTGLTLDVHVDGQREIGEQVHALYSLAELTSWEIKNSYMTLTTIIRFSEILA